MYAPYPENMMESIKKVEATRAQRMATEPRRLTACLLYTSDAADEL